MQGAECIGGTLQGAQLPDAAATHDIKQCIHDMQGHARKARDACTTHAHPAGRITTQHPHVPYMPAATLDCAYGANVAVALQQIGTEDATQLFTLQRHFLDSQHTMRAKSSQLEVLRRNPSLAKGIQHKVESIQLQTSTHLPFCQKHPPANNQVLHLAACQYAHQLPQHQPMLTLLCQKLLRPLRP